MKLNFDNSISTASAANSKSQPHTQLLVIALGEWGKIFPDPAMTLAAVDRLVHHATILEMNVESYRRKQAVNTKRGKGRPASFATAANTTPD